VSIRQHCGGGTRWDRFRHKFESLEARQCLSAAATAPLVAPTASIVVSGHTLLIDTDAGADTVKISDDAKGDISAVLTTATGGTITGGGSSITDVEVNGRGNDAVNYQLTGLLTNSEALMFCLGKGNSQVSLDFSQGVSASKLGISLDGSGADTVQAKFGAIENTDLWFGSHQGNGGSYFLTFGGNITGASHAVFDAAGQGANTFDAEADNVNIDPNALLDIHLRGGVGPDKLTVNYSGVVNGKLNVEAEGGKGNDTIAANLTINQGSTGKVHAAVFGGVGDDNETLNVYDNSGGQGSPSTLAALDAEIGNVLGHNTLVYTPNVKVINKHA